MSPGGSHCRCRPGPQWGVALVRRPVPACAGPWREVARRGHQRLETKSQVQDTLVSFLASVWGTSDANAPRTTDAPGDGEPQPATASAREPVDPSPAPLAVVGADLDASLPDPDSVWAAALALQPQSTPADIPVGGPLLPLQGLRPQTRVAVVKLALECLREHAQDIPAALWAADAARWEAVARAVLASTSALTAQRWLGYVPPDLAQQASRRVAACLRSEGDGPDGAWGASGSGGGEGGMELSGRTGKTAQGLLQWRGWAAGQGAEAEADGAGDSGDEVDALLSSPGLWDGCDDRMGLFAAVLRFLRFPDETREELAALCGEGRGAALARAEGAQEGMLGLQGAMVARVGGQLSVLSRASDVALDMAVHAASAAAEAYLVEARGGTEGGAFLTRRDRAAAVGGRGWPPFLHPRISSTRALERFRNQLALRRVAQRVWHDVVDIFEDCHQLFAVRPDGALTRRRLRARRGEELDRLRGPRLWASMALECADVATPLLRAFWTRLGGVVSWLLVSFIGRALGLVWAGISMSLSSVRPGADPGSRNRGAGAGSAPRGPAQAGAWY